MSLYRHYKQKYYKYINTVKHSETLEDLVLYETRYPNSAGHIWVRPRALFFGTLSDDNETPRFQHVPLQVSLLNEISEPVWAELETLGKHVFADFNAEQIRSRINSYKHRLATLGYIEGSLVAFKLGYELSAKHFYSWLGGVHPDYQRLGFATELIQAQHDWCTNYGYSVISTKTVSTYSQMLTINIKAGFTVTATEQSQRGLKVIFEKKL